jgi:hypothetical protein
LGKNDFKGSWNRSSLPVIPDWIEKIKKEELKINHDDLKQYAEKIQSKIEAMTF